MLLMSGRRTETNPRGSLGASERDSICRSAAAVMQSRVRSRAVLIPLFAGVRIGDGLLCFELELEYLELYPLIELAPPLELAPLVEMVPMQELH